MYTTRTRTRNSMMGNVLTYVRRYSDHTTTTTGPANRGSGCTETIQDNQHPGFKKLKKGSVVMGDCLLSRVERSFMPGSMSMPYQNGFGITITGDLGVFLDTKAGTVSAPLAANEANLLIEAYAKMNGSSVMIGENLATLGETIGMLRHPFRNAVDLLSRMEKHRLQRLGKTAASAIKATASTWLEYRYGWQPLILDGEAIIDRSHKARDRCERKRLVARAGCSTSKSDSGSSPATTLYAGLATRVSWSATATRRCGAGVLYEIRNRTKSEELASFLGTRARDLPSTVWELIPASFVVDWFVGVGSWLQAVMPDPNINVLGHWSTVVKTYERTMSGYCTPPVEAPTGQHYEGSLGSCQEKSFTLMRDCSTPIASAPVLTMKPLSTLRQLDALSLSVGRISSGLARYRI